MILTKKRKKQKHFFKKRGWDNSLKVHDDTSNNHTV